MSNTDGSPTDSEPTFEILPAIDLLEGRVVRLLNGRFDRATVYGSDAAAVATSFADAGARWLHVVDLDGARSGIPAHLETIRSIARTVEDRARVQVGGGLRSVAAVRAALDAGAGRVVVGTRAVRDPAFAGELVTSFGEDAIVVALDVRDGLVVGEAWRAGAEGPSAESCIKDAAAGGVRRFALTAIERDGTLEGPDLGLLGRIAALGVGSVLASGGLAAIDDLVAAREVGCAGAILGRALYEGRIDLASAIARFA